MRSTNVLLNFFSGTAPLWNQPWTLGPKFGCYGPKTCYFGPRLSTRRDRGHDAKTFAFPICTFALFWIHSITIIEFLVCNAYMTLWDMTFFLENKLCLILYLRGFNNKLMKHLLCFLSTELGIFWIVTLGRLWAQLGPKGKSWAQPGPWAVSMGVVSSERKKNEK